MNPHIETIRKACIAAGVNLEITCTHRLMADENGCPFGEHHREIHLSDVLLAVKRARSSRESAITAAGEFLQSEDIYRYNYTPSLASWNLRKDSLEDQSEETLAFIAGLLG